MTGFISSKFTILAAAVGIAFTTGVGASVFAEELSIIWEGNNELTDVESIVVQLVTDIDALTVEIEALNVQIASANDDAAALQAQVDLLILERDNLENELMIANNDLLQFKVDICAIIDTLPTNQRSNYDLWCGVYGEGIPIEQGEYLEGTYTATVYSTEYTAYADEEYTEVTIVVDENGWIISVYFEAFLFDGTSKDTIGYAPWLGWDVQSTSISDAIVDAQGWDSEDGIDSTAGVSITISGFELAFNTAITDAVAP